MSPKKTTGPRRPVVIPHPGRVRRLEKTAFGWIDARVHRDGWIRLLSPDDLAVYMFLCLVANRDGVSFYRRDRIGVELGLSEHAVAVALKRLGTLDLIAYAPFHPHAADGFRQVLALPAGKAPARFGA